MKRLATSLTVAVLALLVLTFPVAAGRTWCAKDPIVRLNGTDVQILVAIPDQYVDSVNGPINVMVKTPRHVTREVVFLDEGYNGHGETVKFGDITSVTDLTQVLPIQVYRTKEFPVQVQVSVPFEQRVNAQKVDLRLTVILPNGEESVTYGTANMTRMELSVYSTN